MKASLLITPFESAVRTYGPVSPSNAATSVPGEGDTTDRSSRRLNAPERGVPGRYVGAKLAPPASPDFVDTFTFPSAGNGYRNVISAFDQLTTSSLGDAFGFDAVGFRISTAATDPWSTSFALASSRLSRRSEIRFRYLPSFRCCPARSPCRCHRQKPSPNTPAKRSHRERRTAFR